MCEILFDISSTLAQYIKKNRKENMLNIKYKIMLSGKYIERRNIYYKNYQK